MIRNTSEHWGWPARVLHWLIALMVVGLFAFGLWMKEVPPRPDRHFYFTIHASIGITLLALMLVRFVWWLRNPTPRPPSDTPAWQHTAAKISHRLLYVLTFGTLGVGWLLAGTLRTPVEPMLFGLIRAPQLLEAQSPYHRLLETMHEVLAYTLIALVVVHAGAALYHHFGRRDVVLRRMLAGPPAEAAPEAIR